MNTKMKITKRQLRRIIREYKLSTEEVEEDWEEGEASQWEVDRARRRESGFQRVEMEKRLPGKGKKKSDKKVTNEVSVGTDDPEPRNVRDNKSVNLSTLAKDSLASQDKRTNENKSTDNTEKETNKNSPFTIISLSHKKGTLKEERKKERKKK